MSEVNETKELFEQLKEVNEAKFKQIEEKGEATAESMKKSEELASKLMTKIEFLESKMVAQPEVPEEDTEELKSFNIMSKSFGKNGLEDSQSLKDYHTELKNYLKLGESGIDKKTLAEGIDSDGGYLVMPQVANRIIKKVFETSPMRTVASVERTSSDVYEYIVDFEEFDADYVCELKKELNDQNATFDKLMINVNEISAEPKASQRVLEDAAIDLESWIAEKLTNKFMRLDNTNFINGDGKNKPRGLMTMPEGNVYGKVERITSGTANVIEPNDILKLAAALKDEYAANASILMSRQVFYKMLQYVGNDKHNIIDIFSKDKVELKILGYPVVFMQDMPKVDTTGTECVAFGDFKRAYTIVDRVGMSILRDPYTSKGVVKFYSRMRTGGHPTNTEAYKILKIK